MQADWHEKHILLKVAFPLSARNDKATFEIPYGTVERPTTRNTPAEKAQFEVPALRWADSVGLRPHGFSACSTTRKYGYDAKDNVLRLSLLRGPEYPDPERRPGTSRVHLLALSARGHVARSDDRSPGLRGQLSADGRRPPRTIRARCRRRSRSSRRRKTTSSSPRSRKTPMTTRSSCASTSGRARRATST